MEYIKTAQAYVWTVTLIDAQGVRYNPLMVKRVHTHGFCATTIPGPAGLVHCKKSYLRPFIQHSIYTLVGGASQHNKYIESTVETETLQQR